LIADGAMDIGLSMIFQLTCDGATQIPRQHKEVKRMEQNIRMVTQDLIREIADLTLQLTKEAKNLAVNDPSLPALLKELRECAHALHYLSNV